jgi:Cft2 family RNA processing exonuclease
LQDVEKVFEKIELVSFNEHRKFKTQQLLSEGVVDTLMSTLGAQTETEIILSAHPSGSAIGGTCWKIEYNKQLIVYAVDMNDVPLTISVPMMRFSDFKNANILITNSYYKPKMQVPNNGLVSTGSSKSYKFLSDEKLKSKLEKVLVDLGGQILIPISDKNMIMQCLITLEQIFASNSKL